MPLSEFENMEALRPLIGKKVAVSDWFTITQERINQFADATGDHQWIHVDVERAARESPYKTTIAHGFLTLSLLAGIAIQTIKIKSVKMGVNYGFNRVRFTDAVPAGARIRAHFVLKSMEEMPTDNGSQTVWDVTVEREGSTKPVLVAEWLGRRYE
ncbi:MAG: MaoC family dehydratase [Burkholderiales bacterium]